MIRSAFRLLKAGSAAFSNTVVAQSRKIEKMEQEQQVPQVSEEPQAPQETVTETVYGFVVKDIHGKEISLGDYKGKVLLIVNVASFCGLTRTNYKELVELYGRYNESGLKILAFPCNQFSNQEPGSSNDILCFANSKNVTFDMFEKIDVNGENADPLWTFLKQKQPGTLGNGIKWNFTKFLVNRAGVPVGRYAPITAPNKMVKDIEKYLAEK